MKIGILQTGAPPEPLAARFPSYSHMFQQLLGTNGDTFSTYDVRAGGFPDRVDAEDAYVITGSSAGVYDDLPWIEPLKDFLVAAQGRGLKLVGVCFGHQIMAEAFGGKVIKSPKGWGVGLATYDVHEHEPWMDDATAIAVPVSHQDQVVELPPAARVIAGSDFTPCGALAYTDQPAISFQQHPEFAPEYARTLIEARRGTRYDDAQADAAIESLRQPNDRARVGRWIRRFLEG